MKKAMVLTFILLTNLFVASGNGQTQPINIGAYYAAISSNNVNEINAQLEILKTSSTVDKDAYQGALLMKKAGIVSKPIEKLNLFKAGRLKLEEMIQKHSENVEYRFIRVIIQENAPKFLHYNSELSADCTIINESFNKLSPALQRIVTNYCKHSKKLDIQEDQMDAR